MKTQINITHSHNLPKALVNQLLSLGAIITTTKGTRRKHTKDYKNGKVFTLLTVRNTTGYLGVSENRDHTFRADFEGKYLGRRATAEDAYQLYLDAKENK